jgi:L-alanine-DL-glutamate epimerase-like enolase superfamily enzyme
MGPALLGLDPTQVEVVYARMDAALHGHAYAKSPIDIACWDILGQSCGKPLSVLLGGTFQPEYPVLGAIGMSSPERMVERCHAMREAGFRRTQIKVGGDWREDVRRVEACLEVVGDFEVVTFDANGHWRLHEAASFVAAIEERPINVEQPCRTLEQCLAIRRRTARPMVLDESLDGLDAVIEAHAQDGMDAAMLKLSRFGGISRLRQARDLLQRWGVAVTIEDAGGGDVVGAASSHLTASTRPGYLLYGSLINMLVNERIAEGAPLPRRGMGGVPSGPGLGIAVDERALGQPEFTIRE